MMKKSHWAITVTYRTGSEGTTGDPHLSLLQFFLPLFPTSSAPAAKMLAGSTQKLQASVSFIFSTFDQFTQFTLFWPLSRAGSTVWTLLSLDSAPTPEKKHFHKSTSPFSHTADRHHLHANHICVRKSYEKPKSHMKHLRGIWAVLF